MTKDEALKLALEALEGVLDNSPKVLDASISGGLYEVVQCRDAITAIKEALAKPEQEPTTGNILMDSYKAMQAKKLTAQTEQKPAAWKLMPRDATNAMLKAMDECSTEGYDERLYAGHAASVYMAAWDSYPDISPQPKPVHHAIIAGALFDFMGWLTSRKERIVLSSADEASPAVDAIRNFAKMRGLSLDNAQVQEWADIIKDFNS